MATSSAAFDDLLQLADQLGSEFDERDSKKNISERLEEDAESRMAYRGEKGD